MVVMMVISLENWGTHTREFAIILPRTHPRLLDEELSHITTLSHFCMISGKFSGHQCPQARQESLVAKNTPQKDVHVVAVMGMFSVSQGGSKKISRNRKASWRITYSIFSSKRYTKAPLCSGQRLQREMEGCLQDISSWEAVKQEGERHGPGARWPRPLAGLPRLLYSSDHVTHWHSGFKIYKKGLILVPIALGKD